MRFVVILDSPDLSREYGFVVEADDKEAAKRAAAERAIATDPRGHEDLDEPSFVRQGYVVSVAAYAIAAELMP